MSLDAFLKAWGLWLVGAMTTLGALWYLTRRLAGDPDRFLFGVDDELELDEE